MNPRTPRLAALALAAATIAAGARADDPAHVLTLAQALTAARAHQPQLRQARASSAAAAARADQARAPLLPQITGSGLYERTTTNQVPRPGIPVSGTSSDLTTTVGWWIFGANLNQIIFDFGQSTGRWRAAKALAASQRDTEASTGLLTDLAVCIAFFNARATRDLVKVAQDNLANVEAHLHQTEAFVRLGTHPAIDLAQARTNLANAQVQLISAENGHLAAKAQLSQAMGDESGTDYEVASDGIDPVPGEDQPLDALLTEALGARPDLAALQQQARAQEATLSSIHGAYAPSLGLFAAASSVGSSPSGSVPNWDAGVSLTWNLFQGGLTSAQAREASANLEAARAQADLLRQQVRVDLEQARLAVRAARSSLTAATTALESAREQLRLAERRYDTGVGNAVELGDSQLAVANAAAQRVQADFNLSTSRAQLLRALGREVPHA